jgi:hypothetical protein
MNRARSCVILVCGILLAFAGSGWAAPQTVSAEPGTGLAFGRAPSKTEQQRLTDYYRDQHKLLDGDSALPA